MKVRNGLKSGTSGTRRPGNGRKSARQHARDERREQVCQVRAALRCMLPGERRADGELIDGEKDRRACDRLAQPGHVPAALRRQNTA